MERRLLFSWLITVLAIDVQFELLEADVCVCVCVCVCMCYPT